MHALRKPLQLTWSDKENDAGILKVCPCNGSEARWSRGNEFGPADAYQCDAAGRVTAM